MKRPFLEQNYQHDDFKHSAIPLYTALLLLYPIILPFVTFQAIFRIISHVDDTDTAPSFALGAIVQYIPLDLVKSVTAMTAADNSIPDVSMETALKRMVDWLNWPLARNIELWVIAFLCELASVSKFTILINVTESSVEKVNVAHSMNI